MSTYCSDIPWSNGPLDIIGSPSSLSSAIEGAILRNNAHTPTPATQSVQASPAVSVATTLYAADYSPTADKTVSMIRYINNIRETLHTWVVSGEPWNKPEDITGIARRVYRLLGEMARVPGMLDAIISTAGYSFGKAIAHHFHCHLNCNTVGIATPTCGTADTSSDINMDSASPPDPPSSSMSDVKSTSKPT
ncbi:hypothetical protein NP233_g8901 [Leucocoprinus birnbaumii]|uniref:Uncharacterized protein n=1 Tax=Leucocoprinus birnbaumii TaxID=56174 RepID=A0AAD5VLQ7_9AGAR|nr:hypothetical protein NP233_g8901 [Leucocoprinus birnbaumii]